MTILESVQRVVEAALALSVVASPAPVSPEPTESIAVVRGVASWYERPAGGAAAGPGLRRAIGPEWRGSKIRVCFADRCVVVVLDDWCQCYKGEARERVVDLSRADFARLTDPSRGVVRVHVGY